MVDQQDVPVSVPLGKPHRRVIRAWVKEWAKEGVRIDWEKLPPKGFRVLPRWWVERTFLWIGQNR